jgi:hypothetical protein
MKRDVGHPGFVASPPMRKSAHEWGTHAFVAKRGKQISSLRCGMTKIGGDQKN